MALPITRGEDEAGALNFFRGPSHFMLKRQNLQQQSWGVSTLCAQGMERRSGHAGRFPLSSRRIGCSARTNGRAISSSHPERNVVICQRIVALLCLIFSQPVALAAKNQKNALALAESRANAVRGHFLSLRSLRKVLPMDGCLSLTLLLLAQGLFSLLAVPFPLSLY